MEPNQDHTWTHGTQNLYEGCATATKWVVINFASTGSMCHFSGIAQRSAVFTSHASLGMFQVRSYTKV